MELGGRIGGVTRQTSRSGLRPRCDELGAGHDRRRGGHRRGSRGNRRDRPQRVGGPRLHRGARDTHHGPRAEGAAARTRPARAGGDLGGPLCRHRDDRQARRGRQRDRRARHRALGHLRTGRRQAVLAALDGRRFGGVCAPRSSASARPSARRPSPDRTSTRGCTATTRK